MIAAVFAMQPLGQLCAYAAGLTALKTFGSSKVEVDKQWRYVVGIGGIPTLLALGFRLSMPEGGRYRYDVRGILPAHAPSTQNGHIDHRAEPGYLAADLQNIDGELQLSKKPFFADLQEFLFVDGHWRDLFGTSICWFLLDFAFCEYKTLRSSISCQGKGR
jgi:PHS family inorganic phosphate transporter-like MFS transporter